MNSQSETAVQRLCRNRLDPGPMPELSPQMRPRSEADAYRLQDALGARLTEAGWGEVCGYKIGCTTPVMQAFLDIDHPCAGHLHAGRTLDSPASVIHRDYHQLGVECELAVRLGQDIVPGAPAEALIPTIAECMAAIELVDARYHDYRQMSTPTLIADDFFQAGAVLGPPRPPGELGPLSALNGRMCINGEVVGSGRAQDILGDPLNALAWLAGALGERGRTLRAGHVVLLGSVVATAWIDPPQNPDRTPIRIEASLEGLAPAVVRIAH